MRTAPLACFCTLSVYVMDSAPTCLALTESKEAFTTDVQGARFHNPGADAEYAERKYRVWARVVQPAALVSDHSKGECYLVHCQLRGLLCH